MASIAEARSPRPTGRPARLVRTDYPGWSRRPTRAASGARRLTPPHAPTPMARLPLVLAAALAVSGCDLLGPPRVSQAVVTSVRVEALDFDRPWDAGDDLPDVYVDVRGGGAFSFTPLWRSDITEDAAATDLPLGLTLADPVALGLDESASLTVNDRDAIGDDLMFSTGAFLPSDFYEGEERGDFEQIAFEDETGRLVVTVRWE